MGIVERIIENARKEPKRIVLPEPEEPRMLKAARRLSDEGIAEPVIVGERAALENTAREAGIDVDGLEFVEVAASEFTERYVSAYVANRGSKETVARRLLSRPLYFGGMMVAQGDADRMVGGCRSITPAVIKAASLTVGYGEGITAPSSFFIMVVPNCPYGEDGVFIFADAGVNPDPTTRELAEIAVSSARSAETLLGIEPRVALLSFATLGSARHPRTDKVIEAVQLAREMAPDLAIEGEFQLDAAIVPAVASKKVKAESRVAGRANVLIFPDLDAGNIGYKLTQYLAGAEAYGPLFQGFAGPVNDLSRGASVDDIIGVVAITAVEAARLGSRNTVRG
jgi:phosphate acetyltransferase